MKTQQIIGSLVFIVLFSNVTQAKQPQCTTINYQQDKLYAITTRLHHATHITLPANLLTNPIIGNKELWNVQGIAGTNHIFIQPNSEVEQGKSTTLTAIDENNKSYTFYVNRVEGHSDYCINVNHTGSFYSTTKPFSNYLSTEEKRAAELIEENKNLKNGLNKTKSSMSNRVGNAIKKYQSTLYTNYSWKKFGRSKLTKGLVTSVWDDGRFTKIRLRGVSFGVPTFVAEIDGEESILESSFDSGFNTYTVTGLYNKLKMKINKNSGVFIKRGDISTNHYITNK